MIVVVPDVTASNRATRSTLNALKIYKCVFGVVSAPVMQSPNMIQNEVTATKSIRFQECRRYGKFCAERLCCFSIANWNGCRSNPNFVPTQDEERSIEWPGGYACEPERSRLPMVEAVSDVMLASMMLTVEPEGTEPNRSWTLPGVALTFWKKSW